jgi:prephenate dehydrogenase
MDNHAPVKKHTLAIIGTGLIGCSMAEGLRDISEMIIGVDNNTRHLQEALGRGWIDKSMSLANAVSQAGVVILTIPVDATVNLLPQILDDLSPRSIVIDAGSVKSAICHSVKDHEKRAQFVAAHPMAGLAVSGPDASDSRLFMNRKVIICEHDKSSEEARELATMIFTKLGMSVVYMEPDLHDYCVAQVSHLPQVMAYCLSALTAAPGEKKSSMIKIAATGYESSTRLASSPSDMWIPIIQYNQENLITSLDEMIDGLSDFRELIKKGKWDILEQVIEKANKSRESFLTAYKQA